MTQFLLADEKTLLLNAKIKEHYNSASKSRRECEKTKLKVTKAGSTRGKSAHTVLAGGSM